MIINKVENNGVIDAIYESSNILASKYNANTEKLNVVFKNGGEYSYRGVPKVVYLMFENAESQGKVLNSTIKQYDAVKEGLVDTAQYLAEIQKIKDLEKKNFELGIIHNLRQLVIHYETTNVFDIATFELAKTMYNKLQSNG